MPSIEEPRATVAAALAACSAFAAWSAPAAAQVQVQAQGFAVERLVQSAPGAGFLVLDDVNQEGGLGGAVGLSIGYAHRPLQVESPDKAQRLGVVEHQTFASLALAVTWDRLRLHASFSSPLYLAGQSGTVGTARFTAPVANLEQTPDVISDVQVSVEARLAGEPGGPLRLGLGADLFVPSGERSDYLTDGTWRATGRVLFAGDSGRLAYAAHLGVHLRPLDDAAIPGSPRGSELLFGGAAGLKLPAAAGGVSLQVGPEIFGATALRSLLGADATALEALLTARLAGPGLAGGRLQLKAGAGAGLDPHLGAPQWRAVVAIELSGRAGVR